MDLEGLKKKEQAIMAKISSLNNEQMGMKIL